MTCGDDDLPNKVRKVGLMLLSYRSGRPLLEDFSDDDGFFSGGSRSVFVLDVEKSSMELSVCQAATWAGCTEVCKLAPFLHFFVFLL